MSVVAGIPLPHAYKTENLELVEKGCKNLQHHIRNLRKYGVPVVVAINQFSCDTQKELEIIKQKSLESGAFAAVVSNHWAKGGLGAVDLGKAVIEASKQKIDFKFLYPLDLSIKEKVNSF